MMSKTLDQAAHQSGQPEPYLLSYIKRHVGFFVVVFFFVNVSE